MECCINMALSSIVGKFNNSFVDLTTYEMFRVNVNIYSQGAHMKANDLFIKYHFLYNRND